MQMVPCETSQFKSESGQNVLKWREHDPVYNSHTCDYCQERISGINSTMEHYIKDPSDYRHSQTCINELSKRESIYCFDCKAKFKFADLRGHYPEGTPFSLTNPDPDSALPGITPCFERAKKNQWLKEAGEGKHLPNCDCYYCSMCR